MNVMSLHRAVTTSLAVMLSGVLLSASLPDSARAGQSLQYLTFYPVPLTLARTDQSSPTPETRAPAIEFYQQDSAPDLAALEAEYRDSIASIRTAHGIYALPVGEQLFGLGRLLQQQGQFDAALEAYEASMHVLRVNLGLYSLQQTPVLKAIINTHAARGDVANAHAMQEALFNLEMRHHGRDNPAAVAALLEWADWNVNLYLLLDPQPSFEIADFQITENVRRSRFNDPRLGLAYATYMLALQSLQAHAPFEDERLVTT